MKTELQKRLSILMPSVAIETIWEPDPDAQWDVDSATLKRSDFRAWQSEVRATAVVNGELVSGSAYLGGTWEKLGTHPAESNPEISGYELQKTDEAIRELSALAPNLKVGGALAFIKSELKHRYDEQFPTHELTLAGASRSSERSHPRAERRAELTQAR